MNQVELEQEMSELGAQTVLNSIRKNQDAGRGAENPYATSVYRHFLEPLAAFIDALYTTPPVKRGPASTTVLLLRGQDPEVLAYLTMRYALTALTTHGGEPVPMAAAGRALGSTILGEVFLTKFAEVTPQFYYTVVNDLRGRMSKSERHKIAVFRSKAAESGVEIPDWSVTDRTTVGMALLHCAADAGLVECFEMPSGQGRDQHCVTISEAAAKLMSGIANFIALSSPHTMPFIEPPKPWVTPNDGGYRTQALRRAAPCLMRSRSSLEDTEVPATVLNAVNALQRVRWSINQRLLATAQTVARHFDVSDVVTQAECPKPKAPSWLQPDTKKEHMDPGQFAEFVRWKREVANWYSDTRKRAAHVWRYHETLRVANKFKDFPVIYFMYQLDYRGRAYAQSRGVTPQGSDLQKALLHAADGLPLSSSTAIKWFKILGSNKFGFDKAPLVDRVKWVDEHHDMIIRCANEPVSYREWTEADCPFQFLAWCMEYRDWVADPKGFVTRLPVSMDGSCNGLQHFSAILRDDVGGRATNLLPSSQQQDIYRMVADETTALLIDAEDDEQGYRKRWMRHGINRTLVKRSVMTLPYGSTRFSCSEFIKDDYMAKGLAPEFSKEEYANAAQWLATYVWRAIGRVVVKAQHAMQWLQKAAGHIIRAGADEISWVAPSGLVVSQRYPKIEIHRVNSTLAGEMRFKVRVAGATEQPDPRSHHNGIAPNFIHSCDASHMMLTICEAEGWGMDFMAMIHDDYGVLAPHAERFAELIRKVFVKMYQQTNPLQDFAEKYSEVLAEYPIPDKGELDITQVLDSQYFFC